MKPGDLREKLNGETPALIKGHEYNPIISIELRSLLNEFENGKEVGESAGIEGVMSEKFTWKRGFQQCWTGWPNDGKTTFFMYMALIKGLLDGWHFCIWPPEMFSSEKVGDKIIRNPNDIVDELIYMLTGQCPYKHFHGLYGIPQMSKGLYNESVEIIKKYFTFIHPRDKTIDGIIEAFNIVHDKRPVDAFLVDPFKNIRQDQGRSDLVLDEAFSKFNDFVIDTNSVMNWIAHPAKQQEVKDKDGAYKIVDQNMLLGGAAWDNGMDAIYSVYRPLRHESVNDPTVEFYALKKRKQQLTGRRGVVKDIEFNIKTNRFYFNDICPIDESRNPAVIVTTSEPQMNFTTSGDEEDAPF